MKRVIGIGLLALALALIGGAALAAKVVSWDKAKDHVGEKVTVKGPVVAAVYKPKIKSSPTFINIGKDYPDKGRFTVVIWGRDRDNFKTPPEKLYSGKTIEVTGEVITYKGVPEIIANSPKQVRIVD